MHGNLEQAFEQHFWTNKRRKGNGGWEVVWFAVVWTLWLYRNELLFKAIDADEDKLLTSVQTQSFLWLTGRAGQVDFPFKDWTSSPRECAKKIKMG
ncbi:hypothetical protein SLA2020_219670 [Shorea laevis]